MRDLLYQTFVRKARLLQAMRLRRSAQAAAIDGGNNDATPQRDDRLAREHPRVAEQAHPAAVLAPFARRPRVLHGAKHPLGVRHERGHPAVGAAHAGDARRRAVRVVRIALRRPAAIDPRSASSRLPSSQSLSALASAPNSASPSPCEHHDRQHRSVHAREQHRVRARHLRRVPAAPRTARSGCARIAASPRRPG